MNSLHCSQNYQVTRKHCWLRAFFLFICFSFCFSGIRAYLGSGCVCNMWAQGVSLKPTSSVCLWRVWWGHVTEWQNKASCLVGGFHSFLQKRLRTHSLSLQRWAMLAGNNNGDCYCLYPTLPSPDCSGIMKWSESELGHVFPEPLLTQSLPVAP